jgi:hypothetical protein
MGERLNGIQEARGSIPLISTKKKVDAMEVNCFHGFLFLYSARTYAPGFEKE